MVVFAPIFNISVASTEKVEGYKLAVSFINKLLPDLMYVLYKFEIISNEEYSINSLKLMNNVNKYTVVSEKRKLVEKYRNKNTAIVVNPIY